MNVLIIHSQWLDSGRTGISPVGAVNGECVVILDRKVRGELRTGRSPVVEDIPQHHFRKPDPPDNC